MSATITHDSNGYIVVKIVNADPERFTKKFFTVNAYNQTTQDIIDEYMNGEVNGNAFECGYRPASKDEPFKNVFFNKAENSKTETEFTKTDSTSRVRFSAYSYINGGKTFNQDNIRYTKEGDNSVYSFYKEDNYYGKITYDPIENKFVAETDKNKETNYQNFAVLAFAGITKNYYENDDNENLNKAMNAILMAVTDKDYF